MPAAKYNPTPPDPVEAIQWDETRATFLEMVEFGMKWGGYEGHANDPELVKNLRVQTSYGVVRIQHWDWLVKFSDGKFAVFSNAVFAADFKPA
jgi:hypothetical protein